jgi:bacterioferritin
MLCTRRQTALQGDIGPQLALVECHFVLMEEYARGMIVLEELHLEKVDKMLRRPGDLKLFQP